MLALPTHHGHHNRREYAPRASRLTPHSSLNAASAASALAYIASS